MVRRMPMGILDKLTKPGKPEGLGGDRWAALEPWDKFLLIISLFTGIIGLVFFLLDQLP